MAGYTPLRGPNDDYLGPRFPAMSDAYDPVLQDMVLKAASSLNIEHKVRKNGTYCFLSGPTYETRAECRFLRTIGDTVGMSTVPEVIAAKHCGMKVLGLSLVTNKVIIEAHETQHANHQEVLEATKKAGKDVQDLVFKVISAPELKGFIDQIPTLSYPIKSAEAAPAAATCGSNHGCTRCEELREKYANRVALMFTFVFMGTVVFLMQKRY